MKKNVKVVAGGAVALMLFLMAGTYLTVQAAGPAKPGDNLFIVDKSWEALRRVSVLGTINKTEYEMALLDERADEVRKIEDENGTQENLQEAIQNYYQQEDRVQERLREMEENSDIEEGEKERIRTRYENQIQENIRLMEQIEQNLQNKGEDQSLQVLEQSKEKYENNLENSGYEKVNTEDTKDTGNSNSPDDTELVDENGNTYQYKYQGDENREGGNSSPPNSGSGK